MITNSWSEKNYKMVKPNQKNKLNKNDSVSTKKLKNKKKPKKILTASIEFLSPLRGEAD